MASAKKHKRRKWLLVVEILLILIALLIAAIAVVFGKMEKHDWNDDTIYMNDFDKSHMDQYTNIALFGVDSRENNLTENTRSDSIIIASIHKKTNKITLVSIYRDTFVYIPDHGYTKINHAYSYGGPQLAIETINRNFDLNITDFVTVNFSSLTDAIDALGGITLTITDEELDQVNRYAKDVANINGKEWTKIKKAGEQTVTGVQATGYSRVRYTAGGDFTRTERQRKVIDAMLSKAKHTNPIALVKTANVLLPQIYTGLGMGEFTQLVSALPFYKISEQAGFPFNHTSKKINKAAVIICDSLSSNVTELHQLLFNESEYTPSDTVQTISSEIRTKY